MNKRGAAWNNPPLAGDSLTAIERPGQSEDRRTGSLAASVISPVHQFTVSILSPRSHRVVVQYRKRMRGSRRFVLLNAGRFYRSAGGPAA